MKLIFIGMWLWLALSTQALAQGGGGGGSKMRQGFSVATGLMALTNSTTQGGQGTEGSTVLTQTDMTYHGGWWGAGLYLQYDKQGDSETDFAAGPRLELTWEPFYLEFAYAAIMERTYVDRAIEKQEGKGYHFGIGVRTSLGSGGWYLQSSYKYRTQSVESQDDEELGEPITQVDGYPLFGIGIGF